MEDYRFCDGHYIRLQHAIVLDSKTHCRKIKGGILGGHYIRLKHVTAVDSTRHASQNKCRPYGEKSLFYELNKRKARVRTRNCDCTRSQAVSVVAYVSRTPGLFFVHTNVRGLLTSCDLQCLLFYARVKLRS
jgi:hypothetical protein